MSTVKDEVQSLLSKLPDDCSYEDIQNHLYVLEKIHRTEFFNGKPDEKKAAADFLFACGTWEDDRPINEQIQQKYMSRKSAGRTESIF